MIIESEKTIILSLFSQKYGNILERNHKLSHCNSFNQLSLLSGIYRFLPIFSNNRKFDIFYNTYAYQPQVLTQSSSFAIHTSITKTSIAHSPYRQNLLAESKK
jgi:hypothetical protein